MMRHVLAHNGPDEQRIVDHLAQLVRPGGHVFLVDIDANDLVVHDGVYEIVVVPPGIRPPTWAARDTLVSEGLATEADVSRWAAEFERLDATPGQVTMFLPKFVGIGVARS